MLTSFASTQLEPDSRHFGNPQRFIPIGKCSRLAKKKTIVRRDWTKDDVRKLKTLAKQKAGVAKIAKTLKRTPGATAAKACTIGVSLSMQ
ncbi:hypothetical protein J2S34_002290 [Nitrobacter winogradskyi]|uniref:Uncharacterized protein n=3 Tax=Nitrobacter winogradskyi TaxID=913 RepID=A0ACC6AKX8_NITWI|nr:hypothetical protein [Nitrobacter winogradskyi]GEC17597.1 hypothetical protein NWI01_34890 [Nitrobacter winogradskyi]